MFFTMAKFVLSNEIISCEKREKWENNKRVDFAINGNENHNTNLMYNLKGRLLYLYECCIY